MESEYTIRQAESLEIGRDFLWPQMHALGWNRVVEDAQTHFAVAKNKWLILVPNDSAKAQGAVIPFVNANGTGWIGLIIVAEEYRGRGWGGKLFKAALDALAAANTTYVGLDAVAEQVPTYGRRGFEPKGLISVYHHTPSQDAPLAPLQEALPSGEKLVDLREIPHELLLQSDLANTGLERRALWTDEALFSRPDVSGFAIVSATDPGKLLSWILFRSSELGHRFGPVYAENPRQARAVVHAALQEARALNPKSVVEVEVFADNPDAVKVFQDLGWTFDVDYHRMWLGGRFPKEQAKGGQAEKSMFAIFDAVQG